VFRDKNADEDHDEIIDFKFEDCLQDEDEKKEEPALRFEEMYCDVPYNNLGNISESVYERNRKRVVRFLEDEEDPNEKSMDGGFMMMGGLAAGGVAAAGILASKVNDALQESDASMYMLDVFDEGGAGGNNNNNSQKLVASGASIFETVDEDDSSNNYIDEEEEQEEQIRKTLLMTMFGMGFMGLVGFGTKKLLNILLSRDKDQDLGTGDIVGDGIETATHAADGGPSSQAAVQGSFNASSNASQTSSAAGAGLGNNPAAMTGAQ
jgi:hypothetical protein